MQQKEGFHEIFCAGKENKADCTLLQSENLF